MWGDSHFKRFTGNLKRHFQSSQKATGGGANVHVIKFYVVELCSTVSEALNRNMIYLDSRRCLKFSVSLKTKSIMQV